jgi:hypothetical protein
MKAKVISKREIGKIDKKNVGLNQKGGCGNGF